jgi:hypothetical protein
MPAKLESCVKQVMSEQGISKERAFAICTASLEAADAGLIIDSATTLKAKVDPVTGFLTAPVVLARIGVQHYMGYELGLKDRALEKIGVFRPPEEVFHDESVASFVNLVVTDDHPSGAVTVDNVKKLQVGTVSHVKPNKTILAGLATITDKDQIAKAEDGKVEVSVGYSNELQERKGTYDGVKYEFVQTKIRANHLAIVDAGRCGSACKITTDHNKKEKPMIKITIDGISFDVEDEQLAQAIQKQQATHDAEKEAMEKKKKEDEEEIEKLKKEKDKEEAAKDAALSSKLSDADISALVTERAELLTTAKKILGDKMPECNDCPKEIKAAVIDKVLDLGDLSSKSMDYVDAAYDMAVKQADKAKESLEKLGDDFLKDTDGKEITRDSAREAYLKEMEVQ